jgi:hypothetical protein
VVDLESPKNDCTFYLLLYPLGDGASGEWTLTDRLRQAKALHYQEPTAEDKRGGMHGVSPYQSGPPDESTQTNQLRSTVLQTRMQRAGRRLLMQLIVAVVIGIIVGFVIAGIVN